MKRVKVDEEKLKKIATKNKDRMKKTTDEFKAFAFKGNIVDMSVGVIIGTAFTKIVNSLVSEIITPALSIFTNKIDFTKFFLAVDGNHYDSIEAAKEAGTATINYGSFLTNVIDFLLVAIVIFIFLKVFVNKIRDAHKDEATPAPVTTKTCPYCKSNINIDASRCPNCTSILEEPIENDVNADVNAKV